MRPQKSSGVLTSKSTVLFWPVGNPGLESAVQDAKRALENLRAASIDVTPIEAMTWREPTEIQKLATSVKGREFDLLVIFAATYATCLCSAAIVKRFKAPAVIWAAPVRYALATSGLANSYLRERGYPVRLLCAPPDDPSVRPEIEMIARAAHAQRQSRKTRIGIIGKPSNLMSLSLPYDSTLLRKKLGAQLVKIGIPALDKALKSVDEKEVEKQASAYQEKFSVKIGHETLAKAVRFDIAVRKFVEKYHLDGIALECWTNLFPKYGINPCLGHLEDLTVGCEGDVTNLTGSLILKSINGVNPYLTDILGVDPKSKMITFSHCAAPVSLAKDSSNITVIERTDEERKGNTAFAHFDFKNGPVTAVRFYGKDLGKVHVTWGELVSTEDYPFGGGIKLDVLSNGNAANFMNNVCGNHYLVTYGDIRPELRLFAEWNGLEIQED